MNTLLASSPSGTKRRRSGLAPLEMVLSLPFLVGISAMIFSLGWTTLYRSVAVTQARQHVWELRADPTQSSPKLKGKRHTSTTALSASNLNPLSGSLYGEVEHEIDLYVGFGRATPKGRSCVVANTWDHKALGGDFNGNGPHYRVLGRMGLAAAAGAVAGLGNFGSMDLPNQGAIDSVNGEIAQAEAEREAREQQYREMIAELRRQHEAARIERDRLKAEQQALISQRDAVDQRMRDLEAQIAAQNPPDQALLDRHRELRGERDALTGQIGEKQEQINAKQAEMDRIAGEIRQHENAMGQARNDAGDLPPGA